MNQKQSQIKMGTDEKKKFRQFSYILAWISFLSLVGSAIFQAIKDKEPPQKNEYYR